MKTVPLGEVAKIERQGVDPTTVDPATRYVGLEHIERGGRIVGHESVAEAKLSSTKFQFTPEHVLFGKLRPNLGKITRPSFGGVCSTDILPIRPGTSLDRDYLFHYLSQPTMVAFAASRTSGANLPRLNPTVLSTFEIPVPPLPEQRRIAAILDRADALRAKRRRVITHLDQLAQAIFHDMFGDPILNQMGWPTVHVDSVCTLVRGSSPRPQGDPRYFGGPVPRLMIADITRDGDAVTPRIDSLTLEGAKRSRPCPRGTVVMAVSGNIGLAAQLAVDACIHDGFVGFTYLNEEVIRPRFLLEVLKQSKTVHDRSQAGAIFKNVTTTDIKNLKIITPPDRMQDAFDKAISSVQRSVETVQKAIRETDALFGALQSRAFSGVL